LVSSVPIRWGGMHFDCGGLVFNYSSNIIKYGTNYSVLAVAKFDCYALGGVAAAGRQALVWPNGDSQMLWQETNGSIKMTVYDVGDRTWKPVSYDISSIYNKINLYYGYFAGSEEGIKIFDIYGNMIANVYRSDIVEPLSGTTNTLCVGSNAYHGYKLIGDFYAVAVFDQVLTQEELSDLTKNWMCEDCYKNIDGCIFACIFDRLKYGDKPYDFVNDVYGEPVDPNHPPRWKLRLVKDMEG